LLAEEGRLSEWVKKTTTLIAADCESFLERRAIVAVALGPAAPLVQSAAMIHALDTAAVAIAGAMARITTAEPPRPMFQVIVDTVTEDAWDSFFEAAYDFDDPNHAAATLQMASAKACTDKSTAHAIARWVLSTFSNVTPDSGTTIS